MRRGFSWLAVWMLTSGCLPNVDVAWDPAVAIGLGTGFDGPFSTSGIDVINECFRLESVDGDTVHLETWNSLHAAGRILLLHQVQDVPSGAAGPLQSSDLGDAGIWQLVRLTSDNGTDLTVDPSPFPLFSTDGAGRAAQACTVPEYTNVDIPFGDEIAASNWSGGTGGIVAFFATGTVTVDGDVDADGNGFRGGNPNPPGGTCDVEDLDTAANSGGGKGEGLDSRSFTLFGRGNYANAGGGGNATNAGGGGGSHAGAGGFGGKQWLQGCTDNENTRGLPGDAIDVPPTSRLVFGGGGGGGHLSEAGEGGAGDDGGGVVLLFVNTLEGDGQLSAEGSRGDPSITGGGGGGGAGGTIFVRAANSTFDGVVEVDGGNGGDSRLGDATTTTGPGGGGGGGHIYLDADPLLDATFEITGGDAGRGSDGASGYGATDGEDGVIQDGSK